MMAQTQANSVYLIGEIGQNHNGSVEIAKSLIDIVSQCKLSPEFLQAEGLPLSTPGINAVKTTKRDLNCEMTASMMRMPYTGKNSFGPTYQEHRQKLELSNEEHHELYIYAKEQGLDFVITLCSPSCLSILDLFTPDYLKVASRDLTNIPLLDSLASTNIPIIISTGMAEKQEIDAAIQAICKYHSKLSILHCTSQYPCHSSSLNLRSITYLNDTYGSEFTIGFSDHSIGILAPSLAVAMGAKIIEKHITVSRSLRGTDQAGSLSEEGIKRMVRDVRLTELALGTYGKNSRETSQVSSKKLERSLSSARALAKGHVITNDDLILLSPGDGLLFSQIDMLLGKTLNKDILAHEHILLTDVE